MIWPVTLITFGAVISGAVGQAKYAPYKGPPVVPVILPGGFIADTKEVAAAKEYFLNALAKTAAEVKDESPRDYYNTRTYQAPYQAQQPSYQSHQPEYQPSAPRYQPQSQQVPFRPAAPTYQPPSQQYTHPQAQAPLFRAQPTYRPAQVYEQGRSYDDGEYREEQYVPTSKRPDPQVTPIILDNGYIADTHEVNAAKAEHFAAYAKAQEAVARAAARAAKEKSAGGYSGGYQSAPSPSAPPQRYSEY